jgi:hypothetical protein
MCPILLLSIIALLCPSMAMENGGNFGFIKKMSLINKIYLNIREESVRFLVRHHYHTLKNENFRQNINKIISKYYDSIYQYYKLSDEERDFIDNITGLLL